MNLVIDKEKIDDDLIVVAGDNLFSESVEGFGKFCREKKAPVLAVYDVGSLEHIKKYNSITIDPNGKITYLRGKAQSSHQHADGHRALLLSEGNDSVDQAIRGGGEFGLPTPLLQNIQALGYTAPTPIQDQAIPLVRSGRDLVATAQTGTGKTAAFLLPVMQQLLAAAARRDRCSRPRRRRANWPSRSIACFRGLADRHRACAPPWSSAASPRRRRIAPSAPARPRRRHARPACSPCCATGCSMPRCTPSCWTRPTRCSTSASCPT